MKVISISCGYFDFNSCHFVVVSNNSSFIRHFRDESGLAAHQNKISFQRPFPSDHHKKFDLKIFSNDDYLFRLSVFVSAADQPLNEQDTRFALAVVELQVTIYP